MRLPFQRVRPMTKPAPSGIPRLTRADRHLLFWTMLLRLLALVAAVAALFYVVAQVVSRTDWMRHRLEAYLSDFAGMPVRIDGRVRATEALNLRIRDVISVDGDSGLTIGILRIRWRLFPPAGESHVKSIWAENVQLNLTRAADGSIRPAFLAQLGRQAAGYAGIPIPAAPEDETAVAPAPAEKTAAPAPDASPQPVLPLFRLQNARVFWRTADDTLLASATGIDLTIRTLALPEIGMNPVLGPEDARSVMHWRGYAETVVVPPSINIKGLRIDLVHSGDRDFLSHLSAADWGQHPAPRNPADVPPDVAMLLDDATFVVPDP
ncbi:MAG: hypothetical protein IJT88_09665 [Kiritimatiellae bacterium]|nr:hypothetical protein [Kiritimatiellia bacterium]